MRFFLFHFLLSLYFLVSMFLPFEDFFRSLFRFLPLSSPCFFSLFGKLYGACVFICCQNAVRYGRVSECVFLHESSDYVFVYGCCTTNRIRQRWNTFATHLHISSGGRGNLWYQFSVRIGMMILCCLFALACVFFVAFFFHSLVAACRNILYVPLNCAVAKAKAFPFNSYV